LAADVDTGLEIEEDPDDLDSDEEYQADDPDGLFEEREEESDSKRWVTCSNSQLTATFSAHAYTSAVFAIAYGQADAGLQGTARRPPARRRSDKCCRNIAHHPKY
jgi:hypothetical protein